ncbi:Hypothetical protein CINCED_3A003817 [Cinara cedri]|nr:Hypothetical protein CINCED_3A003817 [Cinara cedri]
MERWKKITYIVALYMFLTQSRPLEPFMTAYLTSNGDISLSEVANTVEAIKSYSALFTAVIMLISADYLQYKPNLIFLTIWAFISYSILIESSDYTWIRVSTVGIGGMFNNNILAFSYLYAQIENVEDFKIATSIVTIAAQLGTFFGDVLAQTIVNASGGIYTALPYCNVLFMFLAIILTCSYPSTKRKCQIVSDIIVANEKSWLLERNVKFYNTKSEKVHYKNLPTEKHKNAVVIPFLKELFVNFKTSYSNWAILKRCLWYIFSMAAYIEVLANMNVLYSYVVEKSDNQEVLTNGTAEAIVTLSGAVGAYLIAKVNLDWSRYCDMFIAVNSALMGILIMSCYCYDHLIYIYVTYILYGVVCQASFVIIYAEIAKELNRHCYSLVLELNYFGALSIVLIMTIFLIQFNFMSITIPGRFLFIGGLHLILGIVYISISIFEECRKKY